MPWMCPWCCQYQAAPRGGPGLWRAEQSGYFSRSQAGERGTFTLALSQPQRGHSPNSVPDKAKAHYDLSLWTPNVPPRVSLKFRFFCCCFSWQRIYENTFSTLSSNNVVIKGSCPGFIVGLPKCDVVNQFGAVSSASCHLNIWRISVSKTGLCW